MHRALILMALTIGSAISGPLKPYGNARFNYWVQVPANLNAQQPPENGDGQA